MIAKERSAMSNARTQKSNQLLSERQKISAKRKISMANTNINGLLIGKANYGLKKRNPKQRKSPNLGTTHRLNISLSQQDSLEINISNQRP